VLSGGGAHLRPVGSSGPGAVKGGLKGGDGRRSGDEAGLSVDDQLACRAVGDEHRTSAQLRFGYDEAQALEAGREHEKVVGFPNGGGAIHVSVKGDEAISEACGQFAQTITGWAFAEKTDRDGTVAPTGIV
jgi:hypothetical protein